MAFFESGSARLALLISIRIQEASKIWGIHLLRYFCDEVRLRFAWLGLYCILSLRARIGLCASLFYRVFLYKWVLPGAIFFLGFLLVGRRSSLSSILVPYGFEKASCGRSLSSLKAPTTTFDRV